MGTLRYNSHFFSLACLSMSHPSTGSPMPGFRFKRLQKSGYMSLPLALVAHS